MRRAIWTSMATTHTADASVSICNSHQEVEDAIQTLQKFGFDVTKLPLIGKAHQSKEHPVGFIQPATK